MKVKKLLMFIINQKTFPEPYVIVSHHTALQRISLNFSPVFLQSSNLI
jgi:hypothetical protein